MNRIADDDRQNFTAEAAYSGGDLRLVGHNLGVVTADVASGEVGAMYTCGVFELPKTEGLAIAEGADLFWDPIDETVTSKPQGPRIGHATRAALSADTVVRCMLAERADYADRLTLVGEYDFDVHGGAVGSIVFGPALPAGYYVDHAHYDVITVPTSGGSATIALGFETVGATTVKAATAYDNAAYSSTGLKAAAGPTAQTPTTWVATDASGAKRFVIAIATAALTAGKIRVAADLRRAA